MKRQQIIRRTGLAIALTAGMGSLLACGESSTDSAGTSTTAAAAPNTTQATTEETVTVTETETTEHSPTTKSAAATPAIMPNVVCMNLQDAQDAIQDAGVFFSRSRDATGEGRSQLIDSNWIVVSQTPTAGSSVTEGQAVLSAVKIGEPSPC